MPGVEDAGRTSLTINPYCREIQPGIWDQKEVLMLQVTPFEWFSEHIHMLGWSTIISFFAWLWWKSLKVVATFTEGKKRFEVVEKNINVVATNHLVHIERDIAAMNIKHDGMTGILTSCDKSLTDISTGIAILVDRRHKP